MGAATQGAPQPMASVNKTGTTNPATAASSQNAKKRFAFSAHRSVPSLPASG
jgi:hypothetical protein